MTNLQLVGLMVFCITIIGIIALALSFKNPM